MILSNLKLRSIAVAGIALCFAVSCVDPGPTSSNAELLLESEFELGTNVHIMPKADGPQTLQLPSAHLNYYGGRVISNVNVVVVFWGSGVNPTVQSQIGNFYTAVNNSPYFDWLSEYNTFIPGQDGLPGSNQAIGRGTFAQSITINPGGGTTVADSTIQTQINNNIGSGVLPAPNANTLYMVYFPPGFTITLGSSRSCVDFCAYHGTFRRSGASVPYGVMPDLGGACAFGCGPSSQFNNTTSASSHEMIEAVTDMEVGLATVIGRPLAWYDPSNGEIGDICNQQQGTIAGFTVQTEWSNVSGACILSRAVADDFSISLNPTAQTTAPGTSVSYAVNTAVTSGNPQSITLSISGLPPEITAGFSPQTITAGQSSTLTLTVSGSASAGTRNFTVTGSGTSATHTAAGSITVSGSGGGLVNGDFETGDLTGWTSIGVTAISTVPHTGNYSARVGDFAPSMDSSISQTFNLPGGASSLSFWYQIHCPDTVTYDWATATLTDNTTSSTITLLPPTCTDNGTWFQAAADVSAMAGHNVTLTLANHDDNYFADPTYTLYDDVLVI